MKRLLRVYAEVFDEETGLVSVAPLADNAPWPPPLEDGRGGAVSSGSWTATPSPEGAGGTAEAGSEAVGEEARTEAESAAGPVAAAEMEGSPTGVDEPPSSGEAPEVMPTYMTELVEPAGDPAVSDDEELSFEVVDDPAALTLVWDDGVTEKNRRMHMSPFADGMWAVLENGGEYAVYLKRGRLQATEFEAQSSLKEAKALASMLSKRWMGETQGDPLLQKLAATNARDFVRWVGLSMRFDGDDYHFRRGRVRRQQTTTTVTYVGPKEEAGGRQRIEVRLTPTKTGSTLAVWVLWYGADGKIIGSFFEADYPRERLAELRGIRFGPAPGKRLRWVEVNGQEEQAEWGRHVLVIQRSRRLAVLALRSKGGDVILHCGDAAELKEVALNSLVRYLRKYSRKEPARAPVEETDVGSEPEPEPELEPEPEIEPEPEPEPRTSVTPPSPKTERDEQEEREPPRLTKTMKAALRNLAKAPAGEERAVFEKIHWKTRKGLTANGLATKDGALTKLGRELSGVTSSTPAAKPARAPKPEPAPREDDDDDDDNVVEAEGEAISPQQGQAIESAVGSAVGELAQRFAPLPPE